MVILFQSLSPIRHAFYEAFLHFHILLAVMAFVGLWYHLEGLAMQRVLLATVILWGLDVSCPASPVRISIDNGIESRPTGQYYLAQLRQETNNCDGRATSRRRGSGGCRVGAVLVLQSWPIHVPVHPVARTVDVPSVLGGVDVVESHWAVGEAQLTGLGWSLAGRCGAAEGVVPDQAA